MSIDFACSCNRRPIERAEQSGLTVTCPVCGNSLIAPAAQGAEIASAEPTNPPDHVTPIAASPGKPWDRGWVAKSSTGHDQSKPAGTPGKPWDRRSATEEARKGDEKPADPDNPFAFGTPTEIARENELIWQEAAERAERRAEEEQERWERSLIGAGTALLFSGAVGLGITFLSDLVSVSGPSGYRPAFYAFLVIGLVMIGADLIKMLVARRRKKLRDK